MIKNVSVWAVRCNVRAYETAVPYLMCPCFSVIQLQLQYKLPSMSDSHMLWFKRDYNCTHIRGWSHLPLLLCLSSLIRRVEVVVTRRKVCKNSINICKCHLNLVYSVLAYGTQCWQLKEGEGCVIFNITTCIVNFFNDCSLLFNLCFYLIFIFMRIYLAFLHCI